MEQRLSFNEYHLYETQSQTHSCITLKGLVKVDPLGGGWGYEGGGGSFTSFLTFFSRSIPDNDITKQCGLSDWLKKRLWAPGKGDRVMVVKDF